MKLDRIKKRLRHFTPLSQIPRDMIYTVSALASLKKFILTHRIWEGLKVYKWLSVILIISGVLISLSFLSFTIDFWTNQSSTGNFSFSLVGNKISNYFDQSYDQYIVGGIKYLILFLMEVVIFHFVRRTLEILTSETVDSSFKTFLHAQFRMLKVIVYCFFMETVLSAIFGAILSMLGAEIIKPVVIVLIQSYYLGFAVVDNYNEIFGMSIKQSARYSESYFIVGLVIGLVVNLLMLIPLLGAILGPLVGAIAATITLHRLGKIDNNVSWVFEMDSTKGHL